MKLGVVGSRTFNDYNLLKDIINNINSTFKIECIVSGGANGADKLGEKYAIEYNIPTEIYLPDWKKYGKKAGFIRNEDIVKNSDRIIAFWDGKSKGTKNTINLCKKYFKKCYIIKFEI